MMEVLSQEPHVAVPPHLMMDVGFAGPCLSCGQGLRREAARQSWDHGRGVGLGKAGGAGSCFGHQGSQWEELHFPRLAAAWP